MEVYIMENEKKFDDLLKQWLDFREEELAITTVEDKKHFIHFDDIVRKILNTTPKQSQKYIKIQLEQLYENFLDYNSYWNEKYYRNGFRDAIHLIISALRT